MAYEHEEKRLSIPHKLTLDGRKYLCVSGVKEVESFDEELVVLHTVQGTLIVRGQGLQMQQLDLESGQVRVEGTVDSLSYEDTAAGGFFARLFS